MKNVLLSMLFCSICFSAWPQAGQVIWHLEKQLPAQDVYSVKVLNGRLIVGTVNRVFVSDYAGGNWTGSSPLVPSPSGIDDIVMFNGKLYATGYNKGIFESNDLGKTWVSANKGLPGNTPMKFAERQGTLYVATNDQGIYKLNDAGNQWNAFNEGLYSSISYSFESLASFSNTLIAGPGANGMVTVRTESSPAWDTYFLAGKIRPGLRTSDLVQAGKYIWAFTNDRAYASSDSGRSWIHVAAGMRQGYDCKGLQVGHDLFAMVNFKGNNIILYKRKWSDPLSKPWVAVDTLPGHFGYGLTSLDQRLYVATHLGLYYISLSDPPAKPDFPMKINDPVVFPNPTRGAVNLLGGLSTEASHFRLFDRSGKEVLTQIIVSDNQVMTTSALAPGTYYYSIGSKTGTAKRGKVIVRGD